MLRVVYSKILNGWFVCKGAHRTPISGRFDTKAEAFAWLHRRNAA